jgi:ComF family protein
MRGPPVYNWLKNSLDRLLPAVCRLCGDDGQSGRELCAACQYELPWIASGCRQCGRGLPASAAEAHCGRCLRRPPAFDAVVAPLHYAPPVDRLIHGFKFRGDLAAGRLLADLLAERAAGARPRVLLPVPLHARRLRQRGFNQALELARQIGRQLRLPVAPALLARERDTPPQHEMDAKARRRNVRGAFRVTGPLPAADVAIVDDVLTTGHTVGEIARVLKRAGARRVEVWVVARA